MNSIITSERVEINKRMIGKTVSVLRKDGSSWMGEVRTVINDMTLDISDNEGNLHKVDIFDIRSVN
jgi:hypothetical protein